jgi:hypothetical protein
VAIVAIATQATGDTIEASLVNDLRDNIVVTDARTGGDPGAANKLLVSISATAAAWVARQLAVLDALGASPTFEGGGTFPGTVSIQNLGVPGTVAVVGAVTGGSGAFAGALSAASVSAASATITAINAGSVNTTAFSTSDGTQVANLNASKVAGKIPTATPAAAALPLADGAGHLDAWVTASAGVPSGLIAAFESAAAIAVGWARYTAADGRMLVGAGTTFGVTYLEANNYGASWAHKHAGNSYATSVTGSATGGPSDTTANSTAANGVASGAGNAAAHPHAHSLNGVSLAVAASGTATGDTTDASWVIPSRAVVWAQKS